MRKIFFIILTCLCCSCNNILDVVPENSVTYTNFFKTEQDVFAIITQINSYIETNLTDNPQALVGIRADIVNDYSISAWRNLSPSIALGDMRANWRGMYDIIYLANVLLDNIHQATEVAPERIDFYRGQACFAKGLAYFFISQWWGDAIITENSTNMLAYGKRSVVEVVSEAIDNAEKAYRLLPVYEKLMDAAGKVITSKQYGCKGSAAALLAQAYAWKGAMIDLMGVTGQNRKECFESSIKWSTILIEKEAGYYDLADTPEEVAAVTMKGGDRESIFEFESELDLKEWTNCQVPGRYLVGWPVNETQQMGEIMYNSLCITNATVREIFAEGDKRRDAYFYDFDNMCNEDEMITQGCAYVYKWREGVYSTLPWDPMGKEWRSLKANYVYWRLTDIYLLRAECYARLGDARAISDLNRIRMRAGVDEYPAAGETDLMYAIFREREKELLFEGHRYYDIIRNGYDYIKREMGGAFTRLSLQDVRNGAIFCPITDEAFKLNDKLRQNIYWQRYQ